MTGSDEWRWTDDQGVQRLVKADELREALASGVLLPSTLVWRDGMAEWAPAFTMPEFASATLAAPKEQGGPRGSAQPGDTEEPARKMMHTLTGLQAPEDEPPSPSSSPIIVPHAGGEPTRQAAGRVITQLPRYGAPSVEDAPAIPPAPRLPTSEPDPAKKLGAGAPSSKSGAEAKRKARTSDIDELWATPPFVLDASESAEGLIPLGNLDAPAIPMPTRGPEERTAPGTGMLGHLDERAIAAPAKLQGGSTTSAGLGPPKLAPPPPPPRRGPIALAHPLIPRKKPPLPPPARPPVAAARTPEARTQAQPRAEGGKARPTTPATTPSEPLPLTTKKPPSLPPPAMTLKPAAMAMAFDPNPANHADATEPEKPATAERPAEEQAAVQPIGAAAQPVDVAQRGESHAALRAREARLEPPEASAAFTAPLPPSVAAPLPLSPPALPLSAAALPPPPSSEDAQRAGHESNRPPPNPKITSNRPPPLAPAAPQSPPQAAARHVSATAARDAGEGPSRHAGATPARDARAALARGGSDARAHTASATSPRDATEKAAAHVSTAPPPLAPPIAGSESAPPPRERTSFVGQQVAVPVASLVGAGGALIVCIVFAFFFGRCSVVDEERKTALVGLGLLRHRAKELTLSAPKPCWVTRQPVMWASKASKSIPFDVVPVGDAGFEIGYASDVDEAVGVDVRAQSGRTQVSFKEHVDGEIERVAPLPDKAGSFLVSTASSAIRSALPVLASPPFVIGLNAGGLVEADDANATARPIWSMGEGVSSLRLAGGKEGLAVTFRRDNAIWAGWVGADRAARSRLVQVVGSSGSVGKPMSSWNGAELAVVFADKPADGQSWELRLAHAPAPTPPTSAAVFTLPTGGPGGDAFAPDIAGLPDGRWLLVWTEGAAGSRAIRAQTLASDYSLIGDPIALSPPAGNFGQGVLGISGGYATVVFLSKGKSAYELWGAILQCG